MTGFFAIRKNAVLLDRLRPQGFKILTEILLAHPDIRRCEVPFDFAKRQTGESKGDARQGLLFFGQLLRHRVLP
jgi:dolichol-phosphate mannosyltransferase